MENERHYIPYEYPKYEKGFARVKIYFANGGKSRGMFYWNGTKPTFASYGSDVTKRVTCWEYDKGGEQND